MAQKRSDSSFKNKVDEEGKNSGKQNASFETNALNYNEEVFQLLMGVNKWTMYFMEKLGIKKKDSETNHSLRLPNFFEKQFFCTNSISLFAHSPTYSGKVGEYVLNRE